MSAFTTVGMMSNYYTSPITLVVSSTCGAYFILYVSKKIDDCLTTKNIFKKFLCFLGKSTFIVLATHLFFFKIITLIQIIFYKNEWFYLACYPIYKADSFWCILYVLIGTTIPLIIKFLYNKIKNIINIKSHS